MITDSSNLDDIMNKLESKPKQPLNIHKRKGMKSSFSTLNACVTLLSQLIFVCTFAYLAIQKLIYRIPLECQIIYNEYSLCKIIQTTIHAIIILRIVRNILKIYKKKDKTAKVLTFSYILNSTITLNMYRYYLGIKILVVTLFGLQFILENILIITETQVWGNVINQNLKYYFACATLMQVVIFDLIYELFVIYGGRYQIGKSKRNSIGLRFGCCYESFCKFKLIPYLFEYYKSTKENYLVYTQNKGIPIF